MKKAYARKNAGFTLAEVLIATAIIAIVIGISIIAVVGIKGNIEMTRLDSTAREIYIAAQNRLTALNATGQTGLPAEGSVAFFADGELPMPSDFTETSDDQGGGIQWEEYKKNYYYIVGGNGASGGFVHFLPRGSIDEQVRSEGYYIIEYNALTGVVYGVFYAESPISYDNVLALADRSRDTRRAASPRLGYYGGTDVAALEKAETAAPSIRLVNDEELYLEITTLEDTLYTVTLSQSINGTEVSSTLVFRTGGDGAETLPSLEGQALTPERYEKDISAPQVIYRFTLDSLEKGLGFAGLSGDLAASGDYVPGLDIQASVTAQDMSRPSMVSLPSVARENSLFDSRSQGMVHIAKGRHLQNLEPLVSGVDSTVTAAVQDQAIGWGYYDTVDTGRAQGSFLSIDNAALKSYSGNGNPITGLRPVENGGYCGLFARLYDADVSYVALVNEIAASGQYAGGLVGYAQGGSISNCRIYISLAEMESRLSVGDYVASFVVSGQEYSGGLVGRCDNTVITASLYAGGQVTSTGTGVCYTGGLLGYGDNVTVSQSYSNTDVSANGAGGSCAGGFGGYLSGSVDNCYSSGSINAPNTDALYAAGFAGRGSANISNSYCAMEYGQSAQGAGLDIASFCPTEAGFSLSNCFYLKKEEDNSTQGSLAGLTEKTYADMKKLTSELNGSGSGDRTWTLANVKTTRPYELRSSYYPFPRILANYHYGDWVLPDLEPVQMAYYEVYSGEGGYTLGLYNIDELTHDSLSDSDRVVQDGYLLLIEKDLNGDTAWGYELSALYAQGSGYLPPDRISYNGQGIDLSFNGQSLYSGGSYNTITIHGSEYYLCLLGYEPIVTGIEQGAMSSITVKDPSGVDRYTYYYTPTFAKSKISNEAFEVTELAAEARELYIRTERQLATLGTYSSASSGSGYIKGWWGLGLSFRQERDLVFGQANPYTTTYLGQTMDEEYRSRIYSIGRYNSEAGTASAHNPFVGIYDGGIYDEDGRLVSGQNAHSITGLEINSSGSTANSWYKGLFGYVLGSDGSPCEIKNLTIADSGMNRSQNSNCAFSGVVMGYGKYVNISNITVSDSSAYGSHFIGGFAGKLECFDMSDVTVSGGSVYAYRAAAGIAGRLQLDGECNVSGVTVRDITVSTGPVSGVSYSGSSEDGTFGLSAMFANTSDDTSTLGTRSLVMDDLTVSNVQLRAQATNHRSYSAGLIFGNLYSARRTQAELSDINISSCTINGEALGENTGYGLVAGRIRLRNGGAISMKGLSQQGSAINITSTTAATAAAVGGYFGKVEELASLTLGDQSTQWAMPSISINAEAMTGHVGGVFGDWSSNGSFLLPENGSFALLGQGLSLAGGGNVGGFAGSYTGSVSQPLRNISVSLDSVFANNGYAGGLVGRVETGLHNISVTLTQGVTSVNSDAGGLVANSSNDVNAINGATVTMGGGVSAMGNSGGLAGYYAGNVSGNVSVSLGEAGVVSTGGQAGGLAGNLGGNATGTELIPIGVKILGSVSGKTLAGGFVGLAGNDSIFTYCKTEISGDVICEGAAGGFAPSLSAMSSNNEVNITGSVTSGAGLAGGYAGSLSGVAENIKVTLGGNITGTTGAAGFAGTSIRELTNCQVSLGGTVSTLRGYGAGFVGSAEAKVTGCTTQGILDSEGRSSAMILSPEGSNAIVGGFAGQLLGGAEDCYAGDMEILVDNRSANSALGGFVSQTASSMSILNCRVSGLSIMNRGSGRTGGFIPELGRNVSITFDNEEDEQLYVDGAYIPIKDSSVTGNGAYTGGFAASAEAAPTATLRISNVTVRGRGDYTGGFVGYCNAVMNGGVQVSGGDVTGAGRYVGGFAGSLAKAVSLISVDNTSVLGEEDNLYAGGFAGYVNNVSVTYCDVRLSEYTENFDSDREEYQVSGIMNTGGFVGGAEGTSMAISGCFAAIDVYGSGDNTGGFVGYVRNGRLSACYSSGNVSGREGNTGGFVGSTYKSGSGFMTPYLTSCYNTGSVEGGGNTGGFVGYVDNGVYYSCYSLGRVTGEGTLGGFVGARRYVQNYDRDEDVFGSFLVLLRSGVKVTNRSNVNVRYMTDENGSIIYNQIGQPVLDDSNCQDVLTFSRGFKLDSGARIVAESNLTRRSNGSVITNGTRVQNIFNKLRYYEDLEGRMDEYIWTIEATGNFIRYAANVNWEYSAYSSSGEPTAYAEYKNEDNNMVDAWQMRISNGAIQAGRWRIRYDNTRNEYFNTYYYNILDETYTGGGFSSDGSCESLIMVGVCYLSGEDYNENMPDGQTDGIDIWSGQDFNGEVMGKTEYFTGFVAVNNSHPYSDEISSFPYPAMRRIGSTAAETNAEHWGNWPDEIMVSSGYVTYWESYADGATGYYCENGYGKVIFDTLTDGEIVDFGYCYLSHTDGGSGRLYVSSVTGTGGYYTQTDGSTVTIQFVKELEDGSISYRESFYYYPLESSGADFYETVYINGQMNQYNTAFAKAAISGQRHGSPRGYIRTAGQMENVAGYMAFGNEFYIDRDLSLVGFTPISDVSGSIFAAGHSISADGRLFDQISGSVSGLSLNLTTAVDGPGFAQENQGSISDCGLTGGPFVGAGFVSVNGGDITGCYANGQVSSQDGAAGFVYESTGSISSCYALGSVNGPVAAGFVLYNSGDITGSCYVGSVNGETCAAGFVGENTGRVDSSFVTGSVSVPIQEPEEVEPPQPGEGQPELSQVEPEEVIILSNDLSTQAAFGFTAGSAAGIGGSYCAVSLGGDVCYTFALDASDNWYLDCGFAGQVSINGRCINDETELFYQSFTDTQLWSGSYTITIDTVEQKETTGYVFAETPIDGQWRQEGELWTNVESVTTPVSYTMPCFAQPIPENRTYQRVILTQAVHEHIMDTENYQETETGHTHSCAGCQYTQDYLIDETAGCALCGRIPETAQEPELQLNGDGEEEEPEVFEEPKKNEEPEEDEEPEIEETPNQPELEEPIAPPAPGTGEGEEIILD